MSLFFPKQPEFFKDLHELNNHLQSMVKLFSEFVKEFSNFEQYSKQASDIEHLGDDKTHEIITKLNTSFITPIDREDIYLLAHQLDDIIDLVENVIHNVELYGVNKKFFGLEAFAPIMLKAGEEMGKMLAVMEKLKHTAELVEVKIRIHNLEDEADQIFAKAISQLFSTETNPITVIKTKDLLENLEQVMDKFQNVCNIIEGIVVKAG